MSDSAATTAGFVLDLLGAGASQLGKVEGPFGTVSVVLGGVLSIASMIVKACNGDPIKIDELKDGLARKIAEDRKVDEWMAEHIRVMNTTKVTFDRVPVAKSSGLDASDILELTNAAEGLIALAADSGHEPHRKSVRAASTRLRALIARLRS